MTAANQVYHYTECGLDNIYLANGYKIVESPRGRQVIIADIDGLHKAIGRSLIREKKDLNGKEIRFLRTEMGMSQVLLANLLDVNEQAINRWERGKSHINKPAEALIRALYAEHIKETSGIKEMLKKIIALEDAMNGQLKLRKRGDDEDWEVTHALAT